MSEHKSPLLYRASPRHKPAGSWEVESELGHPVCVVDDEATARLFANALNTRPGGYHSPVDAVPGEPAVLHGWKIDTARPAEDSDGDIVGGVWELGHLDADGNFYAIASVDTGNYDQPEAAELLARAMLARLATPPQAAPVASRAGSEPVAADRDRWVRIADDEMQRAARAEAEVERLHVALRLQRTRLADISHARSRRSNMISDAMEEIGAALDATPVAPAAPTKVAEPVGEIVGMEKRGFVLMTVVAWEIGFNRTKIGTKLFAHPIAPAVAVAEPREPLTDDQIKALDTFALHSMAPHGRRSVRDFARAVEAAHGIAPKGSPAGSEGRNADQA